MFKLSNIPGGYTVGYNNGWNDGEWQGFEDGLSAGYGVAEEESWGRAINAAENSMGRFIDENEVGFCDWDNLMQVVYEEDLGFQIEYDDNFIMPEGFAQPEIIKLTANISIYSIGVVNEGEDIPVEDYKLGGQYLYRKHSIYNSELKKFETIIEFFDFSSNSWKKTDLTVEDFNKMGNYSNTVSFGEYEKIESYGEDKGTYVRKTEAIALSPLYGYFGNFLEGNIDDVFSIVIKEEFNGDHPNYYESGWWKAPVIISNGIPMASPFDTYYVGVAHKDISIIKITYTNNYMVIFYDTHPGGDNTGEGVTYGSYTNALIIRPEIKLYVDEEGY